MRAFLISTGRQRYFFQAFVDFGSSFDYLEYHPYPFFFLSKPFEDFFSFFLSIFMTLSFLISSLINDYALWGPLCLYV